MTSSPDETKARFQAKLGDNFGELFYYCHSEWCSLWVLWRQYENLFVHYGEQRIDLLNECGSQFFRTVQDKFFEATLLRLCKLTDRSKIFGKRTLTVRSFYKHMSSREQKKQMHSLIDDVKEKTAFARDWRDNAISHNNYEHRTDPKVELAHASVEKVQDAISALHNIFQYVGSEFMDTDMADWVRTPLNDEMATIQMLFHGRIAWEESRDKARAGIQPMRREPDWVLKRRD